MTHETDQDRTARRCPRLTGHAQKRMKNRSISYFGIELLLDYGTRRHVGDGCTSYSFDRKSWARAQTRLGYEARYFEKYRNAYVVEGSDGAIITAAWIH